MRVRSYNILPLRRFDTCIPARSKYVFGVVQYPYGRSLSLFGSLFNFFVYDLERFICRFSVDDHYFIAVGRIVLAKKRAKAFGDIFFLVSHDDQSRYKRFFCCFPVSVHSDSPFYRFALYHSMAAAMPRSKFQSGSYPSILLALPMSALLCFMSPARSGPNIGSLSTPRAFVSP